MSSPTPGNRRLQSAPFQLEPPSFGSVLAREFLFIGLLLAAALVIYGHFLVSRYFSGTDDMFYHLSCISNFAASFRDGQWIPRTMALPVQGYDLSPPLRDIPTYQYYGFLEGAAALPFILAGFSVFRATMISVVLGKWICAIVLYHAARVVGARPWMALIAACSYLLAPYAVSCFYTRGALAEVWAHSVLPLLILGWAYAIRSKRRAACLVTALGVFLLALAHNLFLLFASLFIALLGLLTFDMGVILSLAAGSLLGLALSAWQWLPMLTSLGQTSFQDYASSSTPLILADYSGLFWTPNRFIFPGATEKSRYFFTVGWWTLPFVAFLVFVCRRSTRRWRFALLATTLYFYMLVYAPINPYAVLPHQFNMVQSSYRLLAFLALAVSFTLPLALEQLPLSWTAGLLFLMFFSQSKVYWHLREHNQSTSDTAIAQNLFYLDYLPNPPGSPRLRHSDGKLLTDNEINLAVPANQTGRLRVEGSNSTKSSYWIYLAPRFQSEKPDDPPQKIGPGPFAIDLPMRSSPGKSVVVVHEATNSPLAPLTWNEVVQLYPLTYPIEVNRAAVQWNPANAYVPGDEVAPVLCRGYERVFMVDPAAAARHSADAAGLFHVELPIAANQFWEVTQDGKPMRQNCNLNHRMEVDVPTLSGEIRLHYKFPMAARGLTLLGLIAAGALMIYPKRARRVTTKSATRTTRVPV